MSDDVDSSDEVMECDGPFLAPVGSKIVTTHGGASSVGEVSAHSPSGQRMLVDLDGPTRWGQAWVALDEPWELSMGFEPAATGDEAAAEAAEADEAAAGAAAEASTTARGLEDAPLLADWEWKPDGTICGYVYGKPGYRDGEYMTTSEVETRFETHVITASGSIYRLGEPAAPKGEGGGGGVRGRGGGVRRSARERAKETLLDAFSDEAQPVANAPELSFAIGGAEVGGAAAERIMRGAFTVLDDNVVMLRAQYAAARRVVLLRDGVPAAAAVVELHEEHGILEVPILAAGRQQRQQGHGSVLVALLMEIACKMRMTMLVVSATVESSSFWIMQGLHTVAHCAPELRAALRKLDQGSVRHGFANSISMAMELPSASQSAGLVAGVLRRLEARPDPSQSLSSAEAPAKLGYEDVNAYGNFFLDASGRRRPVAYTSAEKLALPPPDLPRCPSLNLP